MQFDSLTFLIFFTLVLIGYNLIRHWGIRKWFLLGASYLFYACWNPLFLPLLCGSTTLDWWIAQRVNASLNPSRRKAWITLTLFLNLSLLAYFKYSDFLLDNLNELMSTLGMHYVSAKPNIILPIGISFYTFHSLSYCIDIYRKKYSPTQSWRDYALYVAFFPQLVAGPIVRFTQIREQIETPRKATPDMLGIGLTLLIFGLFEKIVFADSIFAPVADAVFSATNNVGSTTAWMGLLAFTAQIFCDFAGYSTCAVGTALALGFILPINFRTPYAAIGFSDFWRRWHISLSSWLRDYLYFALGGNRKSEARTYFNLMLTMLIGGLWHGPAWTFVIWGGLHGLYLSIERFVREHLVPKTWSGPASVWARFIYGLITLLSVTYAWIWFRAPNIEVAWAIQRSLFDLHSLFNDSFTISAEQHLSAISFLSLIVIHWLFRDIDLKQLIRRVPAPLLGLLLGALLTAIVLSPGDNHAFIYFQF